MSADHPRTAPAKLGLDFWKYFTGQLISQLGTSFSMFAFPLLIYRLTGSAVNLGISMAVGMLPYLLFGLVIGAHVDRLDRKRVMILVNLFAGILIATLPLIDFTGHLSVLYIYVVEFLGSTLGIYFSSSEFAAIPSLVSKDNLVTANGRIQASYSAAQVTGPILAGIMVSFVALPTVLFVDAGSYFVAMTSLLLVRGSFNLVDKARVTSIRQDVIEGLRYVIRHPVLRNISIMMALVNFVGSTAFAQLILFGEVRLGATTYQLGWMFAAGGVGVVLLALTAGRLRKHWSFSQVALTALALDGLVTVMLSFTRSIYFALPLLAAMNGLGTLFNINTASLRQSIVPNEMLGRVMSIAAVLAWSAVPLGALLGGFAVEATGRVEVVFLAIGVITLVIPVLFAFTALGHADRYIPSDRSPQEAPLVDEAEALELAAG